MSTPSRNCCSPNRTVRGTTVTPIAAASFWVMSEVLSVTTWITALLERQHVRVVILTADLKLELDARVPLPQCSNEVLAIFMLHLPAAVHGYQLRCGLRARQHGLDDRQISLAHLCDLFVDDCDDIPGLDLPTIRGAVAHGAGDLDAAYCLDRLTHALGIRLGRRGRVVREQSADALREVLGWNDVHRAAFGEGVDLLRSEDDVAAVGQE